MLIECYKDTNIIYCHKKYMLTNKKGKPLINTKFNGISMFVRDYAVCQLKDKCTYIKYTGEYLKENLWLDRCEYFYDDIASIHNNSKVAYINIKGEFVTDFVFDSGYPFDGKEYTIVKLFSKEYIINREGYIIK